MTRERKSFDGLISAAIFILMEIAALAMLKSSSSLEDIWINRSSRHVQALLWGGGERLRNYFTLEKQNEDLARANLELERELSLYRHAESDRPSEIYQDSDRFRYTPASIVKMSRNTTHNYIIIDKGSEDGIKPHSGIITDNGVVGFVSAVDRHYSYGLTLLNNNTSVSARIGDSGFTGSLVWDGTSSNKAILKDIPIHYKNTQGDTVLTSGFSGIYPPDIMLGTTEEASLFDGATLRISVKLSQDFSSLNHVTVVECLDREEIEALEEQMEEEL